MPGPAFAEGDAVSLHPIEEEDHEFVQYGRNHPDVRRSLGTTDVETTGDVADLVADEDDRFLVCGTGEDGDPEPVGVVGFPWVFEDRRAAFLLYWVAPDYRRQGYATEATALLLDYAFRERGFHRVSAFVFEPNDASIGVLEGLGFRREGTVREAEFVDGEWVDEHRYGLLAEEWLN
jgi:RimJ/RimL family protein N-acetyltransferase